MTLTNAILLALDRIQYNDDYIAMVSKYDKDNPDSSEMQIGARISRLVISIVEQHNKLLKEMMKEILKDSLKEVLMEISKIRHSKGKKGKRTRIAKENKRT